jgi:hypothetical protein
MVRQFVRAGDAVDGRVLADDLLAGQVGAGNSGLLPGDALLLFGATFGQEIAGYAASALVTDGESAQVVPAFSAPISTQQDQPAYMLQLPTSGGAGQVYAAGDLLRPAGYLLPAVAGQITMTMTAPDQRVIVRELSAGRYGYFADDEGITLEQAGMYQITLDAIYAGSVSTGLLSRPVTTRISYPVFVLEPDAPLLETTRTPTSDVTAGQAFTINVRLPADWSDVAGFVVARTPQQILEISPLSIFSNQTNYTFDWVRAARQFPNLETQADQPADVDEITIVLAMTGKDPQGISRIRARIFTLRAGQLITVSGE